MHCCSQENHAAFNALRIDLFYLSYHPEDLLLAYDMLSQILSDICVMMSFGHGNLIIEAIHVLDAFILLLNTKYSGLLRNTDW